MRKIEESELIINKDGSIFHLHLKPEDLASTIILVGDPGRVKMVSDNFDKIEVQKSNREFLTHTGTYKGKRITVTSTGIGTDNIDIVLNEMDAIANIDLKTRQEKKTHTKLNFIRLGTSGGLQKELGVDTFVASQTSIGFDGLLNFYAKSEEITDKKAQHKFLEHTNWREVLATPYIVNASEYLIDKIANDCHKGFTISAPGFYAPQGRSLRLGVADEKLINKITSFRYQDKKILNFEMESSAIYGLSKLLGHEALTICVIIANRIAKKYSKDYKTAVTKLIKQTLDRIATLP